MSTSPSQADVEHRIDELCRELHKIATSLYAAARAAAVARHRYRVAHDVAYLAADGPVTERRAKATVACDREIGALELAQSREDSLREAGRNLRSEMEGLRSLNANIRDAISHTHGGEG